MSRILNARTAKYRRLLRYVYLEDGTLLATVIPSPSRWRSRFDSNGTARRYVKAQMYFIGRAMIAD